MKTRPELRGDALIRILLLLAVVVLVGALAGHRTSSRWESALQAARLQQLELQAEQARRESLRLAELAEARSRRIWVELEELQRIVEPQDAHRRRSLGARGARPEALGSRLRRLDRELRLSEELAGALVEAAHRKTPSLWPVEAPVGSPYGERFHPLYGTWRMHDGVDLEAPYGAPVRAAAAGEVVEAGSSGGYGLAVEILHGWGVSTLYAHCSELVVAKGEPVDRGQVVGYVGSSGAATAPHLHYEVHQDGQPVDPARYLP